MSSLKLGGGLLQLGAAFAGAGVIGAAVLHTSPLLCLIGGALVVLGIAVLAFD